MGGFYIGVSPFYVWHQHLFFQKSSRLSTLLITLGLLGVTFYLGLMNLLDPNVWGSRNSDLHNLTVQTLILELLIQYQQE